MILMKMISLYVASQQKQQIATKQKALKESRCANFEVDLK